MEPPSPYSISISNESDLRIRSSLLRDAITATLARHNGPAGELSVQIMVDATIRELNRRYRNIDEATDVLTFPAPADQPRLAETPFLLGDLAISAEYASRQAEFRGVELDDEIAYLGIHGALHLCGFDDVEDADRRAMQAEMAALGAEIGLKPDPAWTSVLHGAEMGVSA